MRVNRHPDVLMKAIERTQRLTRRQNLTYKLTRKGVYTPEARALCRTLVDAGCSQELVGKVIRKVCQTAGMTLKGKTVSRRTVSRAIAEGGVAAELQIGYELAEARGELFGFPQVHG